MPVNKCTFALNDLPAYFFVCMHTHKDALFRCISKKESKQVTYKFSELKNGDIGMAKAKAQRQDSIKYMHTVKLSKPLI